MIYLRALREIEGNGAGALRRKQMLDAKQSGRMVSIARLLEDLEENAYLVAIEQPFDFYSLAVT